MTHRRTQTARIVRFPPARTFSHRLPSIATGYLSSQEKVDEPRQDARPLRQVRQLDEAQSVKGLTVSVLLAIAWDFLKSDLCSLLKVSARECKQKKRNLTQSA